MKIYTVREFRKRLKEALDIADLGEVVRVVRGGKIYSVSFFSPSGEDRDEMVLATSLINRYACGCKKTKDVLCEKHGRY